MAKSPYPVNLPNGVKDGDDAIAQSPDEGTLFLDKIGDMPLELQPKLLRALQERDDAQVAPARQWRYDQTGEISAKSLTTSATLPSAWSGGTSRSGTELLAFTTNWVRDPVPRCLIGTRRDHQPSRGSGDS